jgi:hypothetical protein
MSLKLLYHQLCKYLPLPNDVITNILLYDKRFIMRNSNIITINKLNKKDKRYIILERQRPLIFVGKIMRKSVNNSITIYSNIINQNVFDQYKYIYKSIQIYKHF